eukprot:403370361
MQEHLRPKNLIGWESDKQSHFETESKRQYQSHQETIQDTVKSQRIINPYYKIKERRMYDIYGLNILAKATERNILDSSKVRKDEIKQIFDDVSSKYNEEDYLLTPCRFSKSGWKYVKKNQDQKFLNHPNKLNSIGFGKASQQYSNYQNSSLGRIDEESHLNFNTSELSKQSELHFLTPIKTTNVRASSQLISDDYSTAKSHYKQIYDDKLIESKTINNIRSKDVKEKERDKEYQYPPLPNLVNAKKAYLKSRLDQNLSVIVPTQQDTKNLSPNRESMSNLNISMPDIQNVNISYQDLSPTKLSNNEEELYYPIKQMNHISSQVFLDSPSKFKQDESRQIEQNQMFSESTNIEPKIKSRNFSFQRKSLTNGNTTTKTQNQKAEALKNFMQRNRIDSTVSEQKSQKNNTYWAGNRVQEGDEKVYHKKRNHETQWQSALFNGGIF